MTLHDHRLPDRSPVAPVAPVASIALVALVILAWPGPGLAEARMPPVLETQIVIRALGYDYNLKARAGSKIVVGVVYRADLHRSTRMALERFKAFGLSKRLSGLPFEPVKVPFRDKAGLVAAIASHGIDVLYLCRGLGSAVDAVIAVGRAKRVLIVASEKLHVDQGAALGVFIEGNRPRLWINLPAVGRQGSKFSGRLLRLAKVIR